MTVKLILQTSRKGTIKTNQMSKMPMASPISQPSSARENSSMMVPFPQKLTISAPELGPVQHKKTPLRRSKLLLQKKSYNLNSLNLKSQFPKHPLPTFNLPWHNKMKMIKLNKEMQIKKGMWIRYKFKQLLCSVKDMKHYQTSKSQWRNHFETVKDLDIFESTF